MENQPEGATKEARGRKRRVFLRTDVIATAVAAASIFPFIIFRRGKLEIFTSSIVLPLVGLVIVSVFAHIRRRYVAARGGDPSEPLREIWGAFKSWGSLVFMVFVYENLRSGIDQTGSRLIDDWLMDVDVAMFGVEPTIWLQRWYHPLAVDIMAMFYATYFTIPAVVLFLLYVKGHPREFRIVSTSVIVTLTLGYLGYLLFPASPPRFALQETFTDPPLLRGLFFHNSVQEIWDKASTASHFCAFPSLHVGLSSTGLFWGIVYRRMLPGRLVTLGVLGFVTVMLWFSTLYLRHHWFADIIAGWLVAAVAVLVAWLSGRLAAVVGRRHGHGTQVA